MKCFIVVVLTMLFVETGISMADDFKVTHDDFKQVTNIVSNRISDHDLGFIIDITKHDDKSESNILIILVSTTTDWKYLSCHEVDYLVDHKPTKYITLYNNSVGEGYVIEDFAICLTIAQLKELSNSKTIEYEICNDKFSFEPNNYKFIQEAYKLYLEK